MRRLVIETATAACSVALFDGAALIAETHELVGRGHAERLIPMIGDLPGGGRADAILVDCGPGSFTGVRVGLAAARALGFGWGAAVSGYSSMALIAAAAFARPDAPDALAVVLMGGHGELFVQRFSGRPMKAIAPLASLAPEKAAAAVSEALLIGSGAALLAETRRHGEAREALPCAAEAALLPPELQSLPPRPIYGRGPDARLSQ